MFFESSNFPFLSVLETNWLLIKQEFEQLKSEKLIDWPEKNIYNQGWKIFGLYSFGKKLQENCQLCPQTTRLTETIPGITTVGFSRLASGTKITPHVGCSDRVLRCHLGLIVPDRCALRVGSQTKSWQEGKCFIFDDTLEHEAWNLGKSDRIVLLIDFLKPGHKLTDLSQLNCPKPLIDVMSHM
ncbi:aspartyl/asparaginyl beta-hydroxylase domain-containing protein [Pleurocapsa sp. PCC 7319]|uniref:aspartyl/asparaginyl beta-hydroxylase domain-containing protein n=1 Tax=Pleurocapsa sp. PCC 7319 TaxID=118161 RepID=UPI0003494D78|nr:aspartyl/asparaginyl beta-hydroxylase domain-containing protein [Pleurocapsa sp. PCC 7319]